MDDISNDDYFSNEISTFGDRVEAARQSLGLSQQELAKKLGVKLKTVRGWEDDLTEPRANKLQMMAGMMNVSIIWLLTGEGDGVDSPASEDAPADLRGLAAELVRTRQEFSRIADQMDRLERRLESYLEGAA